MNWYVYCGNNPLVLIDPDGRESTGFWDYAGQVGFDMYDILTLGMASGQQQARHEYLEWCAKTGTPPTIWGDLGSSFWGCGEGLVDSINPVPNIINAITYGDPIESSIAGLKMIGLYGLGTSVEKSVTMFLKEYTTKKAPQALVFDLQFFASDIKWTPHGYKHFTPSGMAWDKVAKSTSSGPAKYLPGTNIEALERTAWELGTPVTNGRSWKVMQFDNIIGASGGVETQYIRVEMSANTIHGHPITLAEYLKLTK